MVKKVWQTDGRTDGRTDRRTENTICRAAWSQLKIEVNIYMIKHIRKKINILSTNQSIIPLSPERCRWTLDQQSRDKMAVILPTTFSYWFSWLKFLVFWFKFHWNLLKYSSIGSDNGLALVRWQGIIWTNDGLVYWCINASFGLNELNV